MPIDRDTRELLLRWRSLADGDGLQRAYTTMRVLWVLGLASTTIVVVAVAAKLHPAISGVAGMFAGWMIAERHALRGRIPLWQKLKRYIDWNRVQDDLDETT